MAATPARAPRSRPQQISPAGSGGEGAHVVSALEARQHADRVAGFLCAFSFALSGIAVVRTPGLLATASVVVALVAALMTRAHRTLAAVAVGVAALAFVLGMVVAVLTDSGLY